jgi:hypothetical protein
MGRISYIDIVNNHPDAFNALFLIEGISGLPITAPICANVKFIYPLANNTDYKIDHEAQSFLDTNTNIYAIKEDKLKLSPSI